jgi:dTDP-4-dehydrorhamnose reductase
MKILLLGANGSLGKQFSILFKSKKMKFYSITRKNFNYMGNYRDIKKIINSFKPDFIINCIGLTGLIYCEDKPELALKVNYEIPVKILNLIKKTKIKLIHFSSEAVFDGKRAKQTYNELSLAKPKSVYGITKLRADNYIIRHKNGIVIRIPMLFGPTHKNQIVSSLLKKIRKKEVVYIANDVFTTPVYSPNLCDFVYNNILKKNVFFDKRLIHFSSQRLLSIYDLIMILSKKIKNRDKSKIISVKDSFFKAKVDIKPKNLGLKSIYRNCVQNINFSKINNLI